MSYQPPSEKYVVLKIFGCLMQKDSSVAHSPYDTSCLSYGDCASIR